MWKLQHTWNATQTWWSSTQTTARRTCHWWMRYHIRNLWNWERKHCQSCQVPVTTFNISTFCKTKCSPGWCSLLWTEDDVGNIRIKYGDSWNTSRIRIATNGSRIQWKTKSSEITTYWICSKLSCHAWQLLYAVSVLTTVVHNNAYMLFSWRLIRYQLTVMWPLTGSYWWTRSRGIVVDIFRTRRLLYTINFRAENNFKTNWTFIVRKHICQQTPKSAFSHWAQVCFCVDVVQTQSERVGAYTPTTDSEVNKN